jgi:1-acyl-sn-glycerol-3-phosphate acyltransferase
MSERADESSSNVWHGSYSNAWRGVSKIILRPTIRSLMKLDWHGQDNFPADGGMIVAANHLSYADVLALALFCEGSGRYPTFLAKSTLFKIKVLGPIIGKLGQLPVYRGQSDAALVLRDAEQGVKDGACVVFYPEATVTRDPDKWPMVARTGIARLALATGAPVIPVAHWGAQDVLAYGSFRPHLLPRRTVQVIAGPPVDLSEFAGLPLDTATMRAATDKIMADVTALLGKLRGEDPPAEPYHPAIARRKLREELRQLSADGTGGADASPDESGAEVPEP